MQKNKFINFNKIIYIAIIMALNNLPRSSPNLQNNNDTGQALNPSSSPTFVNQTLTGQLILNTSAQHPIIVNNSGTTSGNDILFQENGTNIIGFGDNVSTSESYIWNYANHD